MQNAFHTGVTGLMANQKFMDTIANNLTNISTYGYQKQTVGFEALLENQIYINTEEKTMVGMGVKAIDAQFEVGTASFQNTGIMTDFAIAGSGFFAVESNTGVRNYTRAGNFVVSMVDGTPYLSDPSGNRVLDESDNPIELVRDEVTGQYDYGAVRDSLAVYIFDYAGAMTPLSGNTYMANEKSGEGQLDTEGYCQVLQGILELSGANIQSEMTDMIIAQRLYQVAARIVTTADENEQTINNLR